MSFLTAQNADNIGLIRQILTDNGLNNINHIIRLHSGSRSFAYYADDNVIRFPKAESIWQNMNREKNIIEMIYPYLASDFASKIHKIELIDGQYPFSFSQKFNGKICDGRPESEYAVLYQNLKPQQQSKLAHELALFFYLMHQIDYTQPAFEMSDNNIDDWNITTREDYDFETIRKTLLPYHIDLKDYIVEQPEMTMALCHNDMSGSNLLLNPENDDILVGIIDFGNTKIMPKYQDFFPLYKIHRQLAEDTLAAYNRLTKQTTDVRQIEFLVLAYIGYGLAHTSSPSPYFSKLLQPFL